MIIQLNRARFVKLQGLLPVMGTSLTLVKVQTQLVKLDTQILDDAKKAAKEKADKQVSATAAQ